MSGTSPACGATAKGVAEHERMLVSEDHADGPRAFTEK